MDFLNINAANNQGVFDAYLGLTASGYDLANPTRVGAICDTVMAENWSQRTLQYFHFARINDGRVNPYWPRASILTSISLLIDQLPAKTHLTLIRKYLACQCNLPPAEMDDAMVNWAIAFPEQAAFLRTSRVYADARTRYQHVIQDEIHKYGICYSRNVLAAQDRLYALLPLPPSSPQVITILNPLQADPLTDVVNVLDRVYVVTSHLRAESYMHELIHILIEPFLRVWGNRLSKDVNLLDAVYDRMTQLMYAWDHSVASWSNVFSETLVRVLTVLVFDDEGPEWQALQIEDQVQQGFAYARPIAEAIVTMDKEQLLSEEWLDRCLRDCAEEVEQIKQK